MTRMNRTPLGLKISDFEDRSLLIVDDDDPFRDRLSRAMEKKGFQVKDAKSVGNAIELVKSSPPNFAVVDQVDQMPYKVSDIYRRITM